MNSYPRDISHPGGLAAGSVPLRCHRPMRAAALTVPTTLSFFGTMLMGPLALLRGAAMAPALLKSPALLRMRHQRRA